MPLVNITDPNDDGRCLHSLGTGGSHNRCSAANNLGPIVLYGCSLRNCTCVWVGAGNSRFHRQRRRFCDMDVPTIRQRCGPKSRCEEDHCLDDDDGAALSIGAPRRARRGYNRRLEFLAAPRMHRAGG